MKTHLLLGALLCSHVHAAGEGYVNFVRQTQQGSGVVWSMPVTPEGSAASQGLLEEGGALFQLWTVEQTTAKEYLLDQKLVGAYMPSATVKIVTQDPYTLVPRTRADKPFTVTVSVLPTAATKVLLEQDLAYYTATKKSFTLAEATAGTPASSAYIAKNGDTVLSYAATSLKATDPTQAAGEEYFVVHALSDGSFSQTQIASNHVEVWPVASGSIAGLTSGMRIRSKAPTITLTRTNLYPTSNTYLQVYPGGQVLGTKGTIINNKGFYVLTGDRNSNMSPGPETVSDYDSLFPADGTYTMELLTQTPFGTDRLAYVTFTVDRELEVRAQLGGLDTQ